MAYPRVRDFFTYLTSIPAAVVIAIGLFLPQTQGCHGGEKTPFERGTWIAIVPIVLFGISPVLWRLVRPLRTALPDVALMFTLVVMATFVITIPVAIYLMWGYAKKQFRGEILLAMCGTACTLIFILCFPFLLLFDDWLPAAAMTWGAAIVQLVGMLIWVSAAADRPVGDDLYLPR